VTERLFSLEVDEAARASRKARSEVRATTSRDVETILAEAPSSPFARVGQLPTYPSMT
jgi:hypothetical protein